MTVKRQPVDFYLSADNVITADDIKIGSRNVGGMLAAGASNSKSTTLKVPPTLEPRVYYIGAIADAADAQDETNESNNALAGTAITVTRLVDLMMTGGEHGFDLRSGGEQLRCHRHREEQRRDGDDGKRNRVDFYLSADNVITADDIKIGSRNVGGMLAAGRATASRRRSRCRQLWILGCITSGR